MLHPTTPAHIIIYDRVKMNAKGAISLARAAEIDWTQSCPENASKMHKLAKQKMKRTISIG